MNLPTRPFSSRSMHVAPKAVAKSSMILGSAFAGKPQTGRRVGPRAMPAETRNLTCVSPTWPRRQWVSLPRWVSILAVL